MVLKGTSFLMKYKIHKSSFYYMCMLFSFLLDYLPYCYSFVDCLVRASPAPLHVESALSATPDWWKHTECRSPQNSHESSQRPDSPYNIQKNNTFRSQRPDSPYRIHQKHNSFSGRRPYFFPQETHKNSFFSIRGQILPTKICRYAEARLSLQVHVQKLLSKAQFSPLKNTNTCHSIVWGYGTLQ